MESDYSEFKKELAGAASSDKLLLEGRLILRGIEIE